MWMLEKKRDSITCDKCGKKTIIGLTIGWVNQIETIYNKGFCLKQEEGKWRSFCKECK